MIQSDYILLLSSWGKGAAPPNMAKHGLGVLSLRFSKGAVDIILSYSIMLLAVDETDHEEKCPAPRTLYIACMGSGILIMSN